MSKKKKKQPEEQKPNEWIPLTEDTPKGDQEVEILSYVICKAKYQPGCKEAEWVADEMVEQTGEVTHWRPIDDANLLDFGSELVDEETESK